MKEVCRLLDKAETNLGAPRHLLAGQYVDAAASRLYYAAVHVAQALLLSLGQSCSKHGAVIAAYGKEFRKTRRLDPKYDSLLREVFDDRQAADYEMESCVVAADARRGSSRSSNSWRTRQAVDSGPDSASDG